ncbi:MAG: EVE domain-containing protein [Deltaproteobacteria bacterium]|nr:EVE domain-containing protein [Candidatus Anaeroferrophillus wilburensis]MBN2888144.1 EVE domain-containing protein [Deltaproteobacteria bacterium]
MRYWLMKSEPSAYSIEDLARDARTSWDGVRNYQVRNFMRDEMEVGDPVLFYHSNMTPPAVVGLARVCRSAYPDHTAWDPDDIHYDPRSTPEKPLWMMVDIEFVERFPHPVSLPRLRQVPELEDMLVLRKGVRLSVQPVEEYHFLIVEQLGRTGEGK